MAKKSSQKGTSETNAAAPEKAKRNLDLKNLGKQTGPKPIVPSLPTVDLLDESVHDRYAQKDTIRLGIIGLIVAVAILAGFSFIALSSLGFAKFQLSKTEGELKTEEATLTRYGPITAFYSDLDSKQAMINATLQTQVSISSVLKEMNQMAGRNVKFTTISIAVASGSSAGAACPNPDPFTQIASLGCITFSGEAKQPGYVTEMANRLTTGKYIIAPVISSLSKSPDSNKSSFSGTVAVSPAALLTTVAAERAATATATPEPTSTPTGAPTTPAVPADTPTGSPTGAPVTPPVPTDGVTTPPPLVPSVPTEGQ
jgi:hypothetical protein